MTHVVRVSQEFYPRVSGPANQAWNVAAGLAGAGWKSTILTCRLRDTRGPAFELLEGVTVRRYPALGPFFRSYYSPGLMRAVLKTSSELIHVHGWRNAVSDFTVLAARARKRRVVLQAHGSAGGPLQLLDGLARLPYRLYDSTAGELIPGAADAVIAASEPEYDELIAYGIDRERIVTIPVGIDTERMILRDDDSALPVRRLLFVGRVARGRNVEALIRAVGYLNRDRQRVDLRIVGRTEEGSSLERGGYAAELERLVRELGLGAQIAFIGEKTGPALLEEYARAQAFVYTSRYDNFGQALLEASAAALPIFTTPVGIGPDLVKAGAGMRLAKDGSDLGPVMEPVLDRPVRMREMGLAGQLAVRTHYQWPRVIQQYIALYQSLLN